MERWNSFGVEEIIEEEELIKKNDDKKRILDIIIGKNFVPSHPFFLLILLQSIELGTPNSLKESTFGYYYDFLVTQALGNINARNEEIDAYFNYISELSFYMFKQKTREISKAEFKDFHKWYCEEYDINPSFNEHADSLTNAKILKNLNGTFKFRYKYLFYYFTAKYFSNTISDESTKEYISKLCEKLHVEEFSNIIMFLTHLSKDKYILDQVLAKAKQAFSEVQPIKLENDIDTVNKLVSKLPELIIRDKTPKEVREDKYKERDIKEYEDNSKSEEEDDAAYYNYDENETNDYDIIAKLNASYKSIEIIGHILKNYYGSIKGGRKVKLGQEAYFSGLRSLRFFFDILEEHLDFIKEKIQSVIEEKQLVDQMRIEAASQKVLFSFFEMIAYSFIKKLSFSLGNENLKETFKKILDENNTTAVYLIDIAIKLQFFEGFPNKEISYLQDRFKSKNMLALSLLKRFVIDYMYMYPVDYANKQRICTKLGISMKDQRKIGITMKDHQKLGKINSN